MDHAYKGSVKQALMALLSDVAKALGDEWQYEAPPDDYGTHHMGYLLGPDNFAIHAGLVNHGATSGRLTLGYSHHRIPGVEHTDVNGNGGEYHKVTVSPTRGASAIARDITARLLPVALPTHAVIAARVQSRLEYADKARTVALELAALLGGRARPDDINGRHRSPYKVHIDTGANVGSIWGDITVYADTCTMELRNISPDMARAILAIIRPQ